MPEQTIADALLSAVAAEPPPRTRSLQDGNNALHPTQDQPHTERPPRPPYRNPVGVQSGTTLALTFFASVGLIFVGLNSLNVFFRIAEGKRENYLLEEIMGLFACLMLLGLSRCLSMLNAIERNTAGDPPPRT